MSMSKLMIMVAAALTCAFGVGGAKYLASSAVRIGRSRLRLRLCRILASLRPP